MSSRSQSKHRARYPQNFNRGYAILTSKACLNEHQVPNPDSNLDHDPYIWERWSESGFESSLPPCKRNQSGSGSGSESQCKGGYRCTIEHLIFMGGGGGK